MKNTEEFQTVNVKEIIDLIESISRKFPKWQIEYRVRFVEGNNPNFYKHIWRGSIEEY